MECGVSNTDGMWVSGSIGPWCDALVSVNLHYRHNMYESIFVKAFLSWEFKIGYLRLPEALLILTSLLMQLIIVK